MEPAASNRVTDGHGIIRHARRPPGWIAPGPAPLMPPVVGALGPFAGEDLCYLCGDWRILQLVNGHRWSLDDLVTAWVARRACRTPPQTFLDLGSGLGSVLLMMAWSFRDASGLGIEAQSISVDLARRSLLWNGADRRCRILHGDFRQPGTLPESPSFDLITGTPPYFPIGSALESARPQWVACHSEHRGGVEAYCLAAAPRLAADGLLVLCAPAGAIARVEAGARLSGLHIRERVDVIPRQGKSALVSVFVLGNAGSDVLRRQALTVRDASGKRSDAFLQVRKDMGLPP